MVTCQGHDLDLKTKKQPNKQTNKQTNRPDQKHNAPQRSWWSTKKETDRTKNIVLPNGVGGAQLERLSPSGSMCSARLRLVHTLTPCPSYTISLLHHLPLIHRHTSHARCVKACLNRRNTIAYVLPTEWWWTKERNI